MYTFPLLLRVDNNHYIIIGSLNNISNSYIIYIYIYISNENIWVDFYFIWWGQFNKEMITEPKIAVFVKIIYLLT
jgi:hypothetical protein